MTIIKENKTFKIGRDFVEAVSLPRSAKCYHAEVGTRNFLVAADCVDSAQAIIVSALASEGIKSTGAGRYQLC